MEVNMCIFNWDLEKLNTCSKSVTQLVTKLVFEPGCCSYGYGEPRGYVTFLYKAVVFRTQPSCSYHFSNPFKYWYIRVTERWSWNREETWSSFETEILVKGHTCWEDDVFLPGYVGAQSRSTLNLTKGTNVLPAASSWSSKLQRPGRVQSANDIFILCLVRWGSTY